MEETDDLKTYCITPEEVESLLMDRYGGRIQPIKGALSERQKREKKRNQGNLEAYKAKTCESAG